MGSDQVSLRICSLPRVAGQCQRGRLRGWQGVWGGLGEKGARRGSLEKRSLGDRDSIVEVAYNNETRRELLWECRLWSQQGHHPTPVLKPRKVIGIKVEKGISYRRDSRAPAMAVLMFWAADSEGIGRSTITLFNATDSYREVWERETGLRPTLSDEVNIPFNFLLRSCPPDRDTNALALSSQFMVEAFVSAEDKDRAEEARAASQA